MAYVGNIKWSALQIGLLAFASILASCRCLAQQPKPIEIEDALKVLAFAGRAPIALSPDAAWVAYTVEDNSRRQTFSDVRYQYYTPTGAFLEGVGCDIWLTNTRTQASRNLTQGNGTSWDPTWSADGKFLAFYSDRGGSAHLWVWERESDHLHQVSDAIVRPFFNFQVPRWAPSGHQLVVKTLAQGETVEQAADKITGPVTKETVAKKVSPTATTVTVLKYEPAKEEGKRPETAKAEVEVPTWANRYIADLTLLDVDTGKADHFAVGIRPAGYWFSPDGKFLAYTNLKGDETNSQQIVYELRLFNLVDRSDRVLVPFLEQDYGISVSWSPDSRSIAYTTAGQRTRGDSYLLSIKAGKPELLTPGEHPTFADEHRAPLWDSSGQNLYFISAEDYGHPGSSKVWRVSLADRKLTVVTDIPDRIILEIVSAAGGGRLWSPDGGKSMIVGTREEATKKCGFFKVDLTTGHAEPLYEAEQYFGRDLIFSEDVAQDGKAVVFVAQDSQHPEDIWFSDASFHDAKRISSINDHLTAVAFGKAQLIDYYSVDGEQLHGALLLPGDYVQGKKYPLVVDPYGGSMRSNTVFRFGLSGAGVENLQILATHGYAVLLPDTPIHTNEPMAEIMKTVLPAVDRVIELGIADPNRLGVMGHSYGGYSTLAVIVQSTRFKAAVDSAGPGDLISDYGTMDEKGDSFAIGWAETGQGKMGGTPWQYRSRYIENSPVFYLDRVQTPLLIVQGGLDNTVPHQQAEEIFVGLKRLGKEVTYANYAGEDHWEGTWGLANEKDYWNRVIGWFDDHLTSPASTVAQSH